MRVFIRQLWENSHGKASRCSPCIHIKISYIDITRGSLWALIHYFVPYRFKYKNHVGTAYTSSSFSDYLISIEDLFLCIFTITVPATTFEASAPSLLYTVSHKAWCHLVLNISYSTLCFISLLLGNMLSHLIFDAINIEFSYFIYHDNQYLSIAYHHQYRSCR